MLTDGGVSDTEAVIKLVLDNCGSGTTLQAIGIGPHVNKHLIEGCALNGRGKHFFIENCEEIEAKLV